jgi:hypothetical protein
MEQSKMGRVAEGYWSLTCLLAPFVDEGFAQMSAELRGDVSRAVISGLIRIYSNGSWRAADTPEPRWQPVIAAIRRFHQLDA